MSKYFATQFTDHLKMDRHVVLDDQNQINFVFTFALFFAASTFKGLFLLRSLVLIVSAAKTCEVLIVSTGLAGWWVVRKTNALWVKVMSWNLDERHPSIIFASQKLRLAHAPFTWTIAMRTPLLYTCASHCLSHVRPIFLRQGSPSSNMVGICSRLTSSLLGSPVTHC